MGKKQKRTQKFEEFNDKPAYAADFLELQRVDKPGAKSKQGMSGKPADKKDPAEDAAAQLRDRLNAKTMQQLAQLKATMKEQELERESAGNSVEGNKLQGRNGTKQAGAGGKTGRELTQEGSHTGGHRNATGDDKEKSFKELFDPEPETDESFSDLFKESKLDWRTFK